MDGASSRYGRWVVSVAFAIGCIFKIERDSIVEKLVGTRDETGVNLGLHTTTFGLALVLTIKWDDGSELVV